MHKCIEMLSSVQDVEVKADILWAEETIKDTSLSISVSSPSCVLRVLSRQVLNLQTGCSQRFFNIPDFLLKGHIQIKSAGGRDAGWHFDASDVMCMLQKQLTCMRSTDPAINTCLQSSPLLLFLFWNSVMNH